MKQWIALVSVPAFCLGFMTAFLVQKPPKKSIVAQLSRMEVWQAYFHDNYHSFAQLIINRDDKELKKLLGIEGIIDVKDCVIISVNPDFYDIAYNDTSINFVYYKDGLNTDVIPFGATVFWRLPEKHWACFY